jgi:hypothetical protein
LIAGHAIKAGLEGMGVAIAIVSARLRQMLRKSKIALLVAALAAASACERQSAPSENATVPVEQNEANTAEALPLPAAAMDRAEFLKTIAEAANAHVAGVDNKSAQSGLQGRRFAIRVRFGCNGPALAGSTDALRWSAGKDASSFEVRATPNISLEDPMFMDLSEETIETVEGFWIPRPWLSADTCPRPAAQAIEVTPMPPVAGIAEYFTVEDSRVRSRSGRAYSAVEKLGADDALPTDGLVLLLEGRFTAWPDGRVIRCRGDGRFRPPACIASVHLDRASVIWPTTDEVIAEWRD